MTPPHDDAQPAGPWSLRIAGLLLAGPLASGCLTIVNPGEIGVRDTLGAQSETPSPPGLKVYLWPIWDITTVSTRVTNLRVEMALPSKEGLTIASEMSILYRLDPARAPAILRDIGEDYEERYLLPVFRSAVADVCARFAAKDMHSGRRGDIEDEVRKTMNQRIGDRGFEIVSVLMKSIKLPPGLSSSIEARMRAEQDAQQMEYVVQRERQEAERKLIEAQGIRDANMKLSEGLTPAVLRYKAIEALGALASSPNAKLVITSSTDPLTLGTAQALSEEPPAPARPPAEAQPTQARPR